MVNPILLVVVPLGLAFLLPLLSFLSEKTAKYVPPAGMLFNLVVSVLLIPAVLNKPIVVSTGGVPPPFGINLVAGPLGIFLSAVIALVGLVVSIYALGYIKEGATTKYHVLYLLLLTGATGSVLTGDMFNLFVFYEILCISSYALVAYLGNKNGVEAAVKYLIQGSVGSGLALIGIAILYGLFGTLNMADIARNIDSVSTLHLFVPLVFLIAGFGVEAAVFPLNAWLPDAHSSAPSSISAILSGIAIKVGVYAVARVVFTVFGASSMFMFLAILGLVTLLIGEMSAFKQNNIKRMLAYSSIGQIGLILFALGMATSGGISGGLFLLVSHAFAKALLFLATGYLAFHAGSMEISSMDGMGRRMPVTCLAFTIGAFSLVGLPPFAGFPGKFMIVRAALAQEQQLFTVLIALVLIGTVIEAAYFFRVVQAVYFKAPKEEGAPQEKRHGKKEAPFSALAPILGLLLLIVILGVYPEPVVRLLDSCASELLDRFAYIRGVLG
jgi:proton-translocating NADH-quinone oxidoreductase chain N